MVCAELFRVYTTVQGMVNEDTKKAVSRCLALRMLDILCGVVLTMPSDGRAGLNVFTLSGVSILVILHVFCVF